MTDQADGVEVRLGADAGALKSGMSDAGASVSDSLRKMSDSLTQFTEQSKKTSEDAKKNSDDIAAAFKGMQDKIGGAFSGVTAAIEKFKTGLGILTAAVAGGALWHTIIEEMLHFEDEVRNLQIVMGVTAEKATEMAVALKLAGSSSGEFTRMAINVGRMLKNNADEFDRLGVTIRDAHGEFLSIEEILQNVYTRMQDFKAGTDQNMVALTLVGRSAKDFASEMGRLAVVQARAIELQKELGIEMGSERQAQIEAYRIEVNAFHVALGAIADKIGEAVMPQLMGMAKYFNSVGPAAVEIFVIAAKGVITAIDVIGAVAQSVGRILVNGVYEWIESFNRFGRALYAVAHGDMAAFGLVVAQQLKAIKEGSAITAADVKAIWTKTYADLGNLWSATPVSKGAVPTLPKSGGLGFTPKPAGGGAAPESMMAGLEAGLKAERDYFERMKLDQGSFERWSEAQTSAYWQKILGAADLSEKDRTEVINRYYEAERKIREGAYIASIARLEEEKAHFKYNYDERIRIAREAYAAIAGAEGAGSARAIAAEKAVTDELKRQEEQARRVADIKQQAMLASSKNSIEMAKLDSEQEFALRKISFQQMLAAQQSFLAAETAADRAALEDRLALARLDPDKNPELIASLEEKILALNESYQKRMTEIDHKAALDRQKDAIAAADAVQTSFADALTSVADGTKSVSAAFRDMARSILHSINEIMAKKIAESIFGGGTTGGGILGSIMQAIGLGGTSPMAAGGVAGEGFNAVGGFSMLGVPMFAEGTSYVPRDTFAFIHKGEAVVPAAMNKPGKMGGATVNNFNFTLSGGADARTQEQIAMAVSRTLTRIQYKNS